jgi:hypothetical protein
VWLLSELGFAFYSLQEDSDSLVGFRMASPPQVVQGMMALPPDIQGLYLVTKESM